MSIAKEVQLFANLLLTGEIDSVSDLFKKAGLSRNHNLAALWDSVLSEIYPLTTRAIFANKSKLKSFDGVEAIVEIDDPVLMTMLPMRIPNLEGAFLIVLGRNVKVKLVINEVTAKPAPPPTLCCSDE